MLINKIDPAARIGLGSTVDSESDHGLPLFTFLAGFPTIALVLNFFFKFEARLRPAHKRTGMMRFALMKSAKE